MMIRKMIIVFCMYGSMSVSGMDKCFNNVKSDPSNREKLAQLVALCVQKDGEAVAHSVWEMFTETEPTTDDICWRQIGSMLHAIVFDWDRAGYYGVGDYKYYVDGAYSGRFGPFSLECFKFDDSFSTDESLSTSQTYSEE